MGKKIQNQNMELSVVIITLNEQDNLKRCLQSLPKNAQIIIVDSDSQDDTVKIARSFGAEVFQREFDAYDAQKNFALSKAKGRWVLCLDADEALTPILKETIEGLVSGEPSEDILAYKLSRKLVFMDRELHFGKTMDEPIRLLQRGRAMFKGRIHEVLDVPADKVGKMAAGHLLHYSYKDLKDYFIRFNSYTSKVAKNHFENKKKFSLLSHLLRPWVEFITRYFLRLGFLDGYPGYVYALNSSLYAFIKYSKLIELSHQKRHKQKNGQ